MRSKREYQARFHRDTPEPPTWLSEAALEVWHERADGIYASGLMDPNGPHDQYFAEWCEATATKRHYTARTKALLARSTVREWNYRHTQSYEVDVEDSRALRKARKYLRDATENARGLAKLVPALNPAKRPEPEENQNVAAEIIAGIQKQAEESRENREIIFDGDWRAALKDWNERMDRLGDPAAGYRELRRIRDQILAEREGD